MTTETVSVYFLGTGGALNAARYQASILVSAGPTRVLLDLGGGLGVVGALGRAGIDPSSIGHVFISHRHLDHAGGLEPYLLWVSITAQAAGRLPPPLRVYASRETRDAVRATLAAADAGGERLFGEHLTWEAPPPGAARPLDGRGSLTLVSVDHLPLGGGASGCVVEVGGVRVAYSGDTRPTSALGEAARGVDLLIHEVGGLDSDADAVHTPHHSTAGDAGRIATQAGARALALTHLPPEAYLRSADAVAEARRFAPNAHVFAAEDGTTWTPG